MCSYPAVTPVFHRQDIRPVRACLLLCYRCICCMFVYPLQAVQVAFSHVAVPAFQQQTHNTMQALRQPACQCRHAHFSSSSSSSRHIRLALRAVAIDKEDKEVSLWPSCLCGVCSVSLRPQLHSQYLSRYHSLSKLGPGRKASRARVCTQLARGLTPRALVCVPSHYCV